MFKIGRVNTDSEEDSIVAVATAVYRKTAGGEQSAPLRGALFWSRRDQRGGARVDRVIFVPEVPCHDRH